MNCQRTIYQAGGGGKEILCQRDAEFEVKLGMVWGSYCGEHALEAIQTEGETSVRPL